MKRWRSWVLPVIGLAAYLAIAASPDALSSVLQALFPGEARVLYPDATPLQFVW